MRFNRLAQIARNDSGQAVAAWLNDSTEIYQRPVNPQQPEGPWKMVTRTNGVVTPIAGLSGGCNAVAAQHDRWMRYLAGVPLAGSQTWLPPNGFVGDVAEDYAATISADGLDVTTWHQGQQDWTIRRQNPFAGVRIKSNLMAWLEFPGPSVKACNLTLNTSVPVETLQVPIYTPIVFRSGMELWVLYQCDALGGVCHRIHDPSQGYRFATPQSIYEPDVLVDGVSCRIGWSKDPGQFTQGEVVIPVLGEGMIPLVLPPPEPPIGPLGPPLPDGTVIDLTQYIQYRPEMWPRGVVSEGDVHPMDLQVAGNQLAFVKFNASFQGQRYELMEWKDGYLHHLEDASNPILDTWEGDTRWVPASMKVGYAHRFISAWHELVSKVRGTCGETRRIGWKRETWIAAAWDRFYCGKELGIRPVVRVANDNTAGVHAPDRAVETYYYALMAAWGEWTADPSDVVFAHGDPVFPLVPRERSPFWRVGGSRTPVQLSGCAPSPVIPSPEQPPMVPMPPQVLTTINTMNAADPLPQGGDDVVMHAWSRRVAEQCRYSHTNGGWEYGLKSSSSSAPVSNNLARQGNGTLECWDYIEGSAGPTPRLQPDGGEYFSIPNQVFHPVAAINHLASVVPTLGRTRLAQMPIWGVDAFDLGPRTIGLGDHRYLDQVLVANKLASRQFMYATPLALPRLERDAATGLQQMAQLLPLMRAKGARGSLFTILCGTRNNGLSWQDALAYCRACNAVFLQFPELVIGVDLFNENLQGFEQDYAVNRQFLREAEACFDPRFSVSPGATWGDLPTFRACGSHLVAHGDRALLPDAAAAFMAVPGWDVIDREGMGMAEVGHTAGRQRVDNPQWAAWQIAAVKKYQLAGSFLHFDAGLTCDVGELGPVQNAAIAFYAAEVTTGPTPPPIGDPILDCVMAVVEGAYTHAFYDIFVGHHPALVAKAVAWYTKYSGHAPAESDIHFGVNVRCGIEALRWKTPRGAWENAWPGGEP